MTDMKKFAALMSDAIGDLHSRIDSVESKLIATRLMLDSVFTLSPDLPALLDQLERHLATAQSLQLDHPRLRNQAIGQAREVLEAYRRDLSERAG